MSLYYFGFASLFLVTLRRLQMGSSGQVVSQDLRWPIARISGEGRLVFPNATDFDRALDLGIFFLKVPDEIDLAMARDFGLGLLSPDSPYRRVPKYGELEGFIALENNQQTKLALRRHHWEAHYPPGISRFGGQLDNISVVILREVLRRSGIPEAHWDSASGGYSSGGGTAFLNFVHYDTTTPNLGLRPHTDYGFVTILDATAPGLQVKLDDSFVDVPVLPGHLAIHFGEALHFITVYAERTVSAVAHQVLSQRSAHPTRHGIVYFANPELDGRVAQFDVNGEMRGSSSVEDLFAALESQLTQYR